MHTDTDTNIVSSTHVMSNYRLRIGNDKLVAAKYIFILLCTATDA